MTVARPTRGLEIMSVRNSRRHWREVHKSLTLAVIHPGQIVRAEWRTRGRSLSSLAGSVMGMEPGDLHLTDKVQLGARGADFDVVRFSPKLLKRAAAELGTPGAFHLRTPAIDDTETYACLQKLVAAVAAGDDALEIACAQAQGLHAVITRCGEAPTATGVTLDPVRDCRLRRVKDYLNDNLSSRPSLAELEQVSGLTQYRLCAVFKRAYGVTIGQYWNALRLAEAVRRLQRGVAPKLVVAELAYKDESYLWRVFRRHYGMPPGAWLALYRANDWQSKRPTR